MPPFSVLVLFLVFLLSIFRKVGKFKISFWQGMFFGALLVVVFKEISLFRAFQAIEWEIILFLFCMFVLGEALYSSGLLSVYSFFLFKKVKNTSQLLFFFILSMAFFSALLMNDTLAIIGVFLIFMLAQRHSIALKPFLLALMFSITLGSVFSPIGNPQNLLIALKTSMANPFFLFFQYLFLPSFINLVVLYFLLSFFYKKEFPFLPLKHFKESLKDSSLAFWAQIGLGLFVFAIVLKILFAFVFPQVYFSLTFISLAGALPILLFSKKSLAILKKIDWHTLLFFIGMFVLMQSVWDSGFFQSWIKKFSFHFASISIVFFISLLLSQFMSNVPFVALFLPLLIKEGVDLPVIFALASGSTIAGNLFILGAASNVIVIQGAEKKQIFLSFWEFFRIGLPLTLINLLIYWLFLV